MIEAKSRARSAIVAWRDSGKSRLDLFNLITASCRALQQGSGISYHELSEIIDEVLGEDDPVLPVSPE